MNSGIRPKTDKRGISPHTNSFEDIVLLCVFDTWAIAFKVGMGVRDRKCHVARL